MAKVSYTSIVCIVRNQQFLESKLSIILYIMLNTTKKLLRVIGYLFTSVLIAVIASPELQTLIASNPALLVYAPVINVALVAMVEALHKIKE